MADSGAFASGLEGLGLGSARELRVRGWAFPPLLKTTDSLFEAVYRDTTGAGWHIRQDGLVWKDGPAAPPDK